MKTLNFSKLMTNFSKKNFKIFPLNNKNAQLFGEMKETWISNEIKALSIDFEQ